LLAAVAAAAGGWMYGHCRCEALFVNNKDENFHPLDAASERRVLRSQALNLISFVAVVVSVFAAVLL